MTGDHAPPSRSRRPRRTDSGRNTRTTRVGETGENGRGLYEAYYGESLDYLAQAWLINPMYTLQEALAEGYLGDSSGWCPEFNYGFFGTNGQISNLTWDSTTELYIYNNTPAEVLLSPSNVATHNYTDSPPYDITTFSSDDAYYAYGGGP